MCSAFKPFDLLKGKEFMKIFVPAINEHGDVKEFQIQCLVKKSIFSEIKITGLVDESIVDVIRVLESILEFDILQLKTKNQKIHFHLTDGSFIKEGTSIGLGLMLAYLHAIGRAVKLEGKVLVSGEIDLYGNVCEVGGIEKKLKNGTFNYAIVPQSNYKKEYK